MATSLISGVLLYSTALIQTHSTFINTVVDCHNDYAYEGRFTFLHGKAEAFWHLEADNVYFEYYFPAACWIGIAASNQFINNKYNYCTDCYKANKDITHCLAQCVGDNMFVATSKGDTDPESSWHLIEFQTNNNGQNVFNQYQIASKLYSVWGVKGRENASFNVCHIIISVYLSEKCTFCYIYHRNTVGKS